MKCPLCFGATVVLDTRDDVRRRQCKKNPAHQFDTREEVIFVGARPVGRPVGVRVQQGRWAGLQ